AGRTGTARERPGSLPPQPPPAVPALRQHAPAVHGAGEDGALLGAGRPGVAGLAAAPRGPPAPPGRLALLGLPPRPGAGAPGDARQVRLGASTRAVPAQAAAEVPTSVSPRSRAAFLPPAVAPTWSSSTQWPMPLLTSFGSAAAPLPGKSRN